MPDILTRCRRCEGTGLVKEPPDYTRLTPCRSCNGTGAAYSERAPRKPPQPFGENEERCQCPDGGIPVIPHGSGDADCARCRLPWFGSDEDE